MYLFDAQEPPVDTIGNSDSILVRKRKHSQIKDVNIIDTAVPPLKIRRPFSPSYVPDPTFKLRTKGFVHHHHSNVDTIDQSDEDHQVIDKLGDPDLILDDRDVETDKRARSQIKGKVGKNSKIKSSKKFATKDIVIDQSEEELGDPNPDDVEMTDSFQFCDEDHEIIDKLGDPSLLLDHMGSPDSSSNPHCQF